MPDDGLVDVDEPGADALGAQAEVGVLAPEGERLVEAAEPLDQRPRHRQVAGRVPAVRAVDLHRAGEAVVEVGLVGVGLGAALEDDVVSGQLRVGVGQRREPARRRAAVVVGEGDERARAPLASRGCGASPGPARAG